MTSTDESKAVGVARRRPRSRVRTSTMVLANGRSDVLEGSIEAGDLVKLTDSYPVPPMSVSRVPCLVQGPARSPVLMSTRGWRNAWPRTSKARRRCRSWPIHRGSCTERARQQAPCLPEYESLGDAERKSIRSRIRCGWLPIKPSADRIVRAESGGIARRFCAASGARAPRRRQAGAPAGTTVGNSKWRSPDNPNPDRRAAAHYPRRRALRTSD